MRLFCNNFKKHWESWKFKFLETLNCVQTWKKNEFTKFWFINQKLKRRSFFFFLVSLEFLSFTTMYSNTLCKIGGTYRRISITPLNHTFTLPDITDGCASNLTCCPPWFPHCRRNTLITVMETRCYYCDGPSRLWRRDA